MRDLPEGDSIPRLSWGHGNPQQVLAGVWAAKWEAGTEVRWAAEQEAGAEVSQAGKSQKKREQRYQSWEGIWKNNTPLKGVNVKTLVTVFIITVFDTKQMILLNSKVFNC